jgi:uncharacterized membrane protein YeaQ/YmgE (transglycosylase-associated protein family)
MTNASYRNLTLGLIGAWFALALTASALHVFNTDPDRPPLPLLIAASGPIMLFLLWFRSSSGFRQFAMSLNPRTLTIAQSWRVNGFTFLVLTSYGLLPAIFAIPAGVGDMLVGATAPLIARRLINGGSRRGFIWWQLVGIFDLVVALTLGPTARLITPHGPTMQAITVLPLSLVPTFLVPLFLILHMICIAQALQWPGQEAPRTWLTTSRTA